MNIRVVFVVTACAAFICGGILFRPAREVRAGCANNPFRSGTVRVTPGSTRAVVTLPANRRLVITSLTSGPFLSSTLPWLEILAGSEVVGVVPGKFDDLGWHLATQFEGVDSQGGFNVPGGEELGLRLVADGPPNAPSVPITITGLVYDCNLTTTTSPTILVDRDVLTPIGTTPAGRAVVVRAAISAPFEIEAAATLKPSLEIHADGRLLGVFPARAVSSGWVFETSFPFVTGVAVGPLQTFEATIRNATPVAGPVPVTFLTMSVFSP
jgi:hypothetical protein